MDDLKPCPFCGNDGSGPIEDALHICHQEHDWRAPSWSVQCDKCSASMGYSASEDDAAEVWNTRAPDPRLAEVEAERDGLLERNGALALQADEWDGKYHVVSDLNAALIAERDAFRAALEKLIVAVEFEVPAILDGVDVDRRAMILRKCAKEARAALGAKP